MWPEINIICPHLKGDVEGAVCKALDQHIKDMQEMDIDACLSDYYIYCPIYDLPR